MIHETLDTMAAQAYVVEWIAAACMTVLVYDNAITFGREVELVWTSKFSTVKVLFFLNRYVVVGILVFNAIASAQTHLSNGFCVFYLRWLVCATTITNTIVEGILVARVWALWRDYWIPLSIAIFFYLGGVVVLVTLSVLDYVATGPVEVVHNLQALPGCYARSVPSMIAGYWISPLIIESILFGMVVWRASGWWRHRIPTPPTLLLLARDSSIYFSIIFILLFVNLFVFLYGPPFLSSMMVTPSNTAGCIAGSRMLLNIREFAASRNGSGVHLGDGGNGGGGMLGSSGGDEETVLSDVELSRIQFQPRRTLDSGRGDFGEVTTIGDASWGTVEEVPVSS